ncbi:hypothetical protein A7X67_08500 [Clostridium sp. W14A]|nr:hypothetical protein A7X67_08500 [Clostridium sp. W14A]
MRKKTNRRGAFSLKWELIGIVMACWILPVAIFGGAAGYYIYRGIDRQISNTITASANNSVKITLNQIDSAISASRYASYNGSVQSAYRDYLKTQDAMALYDKITEFLSKQYKYDDSFLLTMLYFCDKPDRVYYTYHETYSGVLKYQEKVHSMVRNLSRTLGTNVGFLNVQGSVYMVRNIVDDNYRTYAVLTMQLNPKTMFGSIANVAWETDASLWLNSTKVVLKGEELAPESLGISLAQKGLFYRNSGNRSYVFGMNPGQDYRFSYVIGVNSAPLARELSGFKNMLIEILIFAVPLLAMVVWFFTRNVTAPVKRLVDRNRAIEDGEFGIQINDRFYSSEFQYLANSFNSMSYKLKYQFERIYKEELALRDARIKALQSQINPHFLNNTLEIINWEARLADNVKVSRMIEALSTMLDAAIDRRGKPMVHLSEEMMYADAYLYIISERFGKRLTVRKEVDPSAVDEYVPRLILQPVLENAVEHGIQQRQKGGIQIRAFYEDNALILEVENDSALSPEDRAKIEELLSGNGSLENESSCNIGIRNVNQRLKIIFGDGSGLTIIMNSKDHTLARIVIANVQSKQ